MTAFSPQPPEWTDRAVHSMTLHCPSCRTPAIEAESVWLNRRSPVYGPDQRKKWQEFYHCGCGCDWWAWSSDRPLNEYSDREPLNPPPSPNNWPNNWSRFFDPFGDS
jgi:hypothetical protein